MESASPSTDRREALVGRLTESALNTKEICCVYLGDRLGLYQALRSGLPTTAAELAEDRQHKRPPAAVAPALAPRPRDIRCHTQTPAALEANATESGAGLSHCFETLHPAMRELCTVRGQGGNASSRAFALTRSAVSKPSVNRR